MQTTAHDFLNNGKLQMSGIFDSPNPNKAILYFDKAIEADPNLAEAYKARAESKILLQDYSAAISDYDKAIELKPHYQLYYDRAKSYLYVLNFNAAFSDFEKSLELTFFNNVTLDEQDGKEIYLDGSSTILVELFKSISEFSELKLSISEMSQGNQSDAFLYHRLGVEKNKLGDNWASDDFDKAIDCDSNFSPAYLDRGFYFWNCRMEEEALNDINKALRLNPKDSTVYLISGIINFEQQNFKSALDYLNKSIFINHHNPNALLIRGCTKYSITDNIGALEDFTEAIKLNPRYFKAFVCRGILKKQIGDYNGSIFDFSTAIKLKEGSSGIMVDFNLKHVYQERYSSSLHDWNNPNYSDNTRYFIYLLRGISKSLNKDFLGAFDDYNIAIDMEPFYSLSYFHRSKLVGKVENIGKEQGYTDYQIALQLSNSNIDDLFKEAEFKKSNNDFHGAIKLYTYIIHLESNNTKALLSRAYCLLNIQEPLKAYDDYLNLLRLSKEIPDDDDNKTVPHFNIEDEINPFLHYQNGQVHLERRDYTDAIQCFDRAINLYPNFADAYLARGHSYFLYQPFDSRLNKKVNFYDEALADFNTTVKLDPWNYWGYKMRSKIYRIQENFDLAIKDLEFIVNVLHSNTDSEKNHLGLSEIEDLAYLKYFQKDYSNALKYYNHYLRITPSYHSNHKAYYYRGAIKKNKNDISGAVQDYELFKSIYDKHLTKDYSQFPNYLI